MASLLSLKNKDHLCWDMLVEVICWSAGAGQPKSRVVGMSISTLDEVTDSLRLTRGHTGADD